MKNSIILEHYNSQYFSDLEYHKSNEIMSEIITYIEYFIMIPASDRKARNITIESVSSFELIK